MTTAGELDALEWNFRRALIPLLKRAAKKGDDRIFSLDEPRTRNGRPTVLKLAEEVMAEREKLKVLPSRQSAAAAFLLACLRWSHRKAGESVSSAALARDLLATITDDDDA